MPPDPRVLLADVGRAGAEIERFAEGIDGDAYARDPLTQQTGIIPISEYTFRFNQHKARHVGEIFYRLAEQLISHRPVYL